MKKIIAWLLVLALTAAISIGATLAYLTDTDEDVNVMTVGKVKIDQLEYERVNDETSGEDATVQEFRDNKPLYPGVYNDDFNFTDTEGEVDWTQIGKEDYTSGIWNPEKINNELDKMVFVENKGNYDAYVRTVFAFEAGNYKTLDEFKAMMHLNLNTTDWSWDWEETPVKIGGSKYFVAVATYTDILVPGKLTEISLSQIALDKSATNADVEAFGETYNILVKTQAIQADGFESAAIALDEGFGVITAATVPFTTDEPVQGATARNALYYLNGDPKSTKITSKVTNVVYGLTKNYPEIANNYDGVLFTEDQDVPVYAYYVEKNGQYTVYFLANGKINLPRNSKELFYPLSNLQTVDTANLSTAKVVDMTDLFYNCKKLKSIDVSNWDTSNVTSLFGTFCNCYVLEELDVSNWDVSKVTNLRAAFSNCQSITSLDVSGWDTSNVTTLHNAFVKCYALEEIKGISDWDTSKVTTLEQTFWGDKNLKNLDVSGWDTSNVTTMKFTFNGCASLVDLDLSGWDTGKVTTFSSMFSSFNSNTPDMQLKAIHAENWDTGSCTAFSWMFYGCGQLEQIDLSNWDTSSVTTTYHMFADCNNLKSVNFSGWNTPKLTNMDGMFNDCRSLVTVDVSDIDTQNVEDMSQIFESCWSLKEVKGLENWETSKVWDFDQMFLNCSSIEVIDLSTLDTSSAIQTGTMFQSCTSLTTIYVGDGWDMSKVTDSGNMFNNCPKLVGANGTTTAGNPTDVTYARVDTPETPGYLTYKPVNP